MKNLNTPEFTKLNKAQKIELLAKHKVVEKLINNIVIDSEMIEELAQDIYLILLTKDEKRLNAMCYTDYRNLIITICRNQWNSNTSPFYKTNKRHQIYKAQLEGFDVCGETGQIVPLGYDD